MDGAKIQVETNEKFTIEEEEDWIESLTCGYCVQNREFKMSINPAMTSSREIVSIKEDAEFLCKCLLHPRCRAFKGTLYSSEGNEAMFTYEKPCGIPICMFCRPEFDVFNHEQKKIGTIKNECSFCEMKMHILDPSGQPLYTISGTMLSPGFLCEPMFGSCFPLSFDINDERKGGTTVSQFKKESRGLLPECCNNADKFSIQMPSQMNYHERILLSVAIHEMNMLWFERKAPCAFMSRQ
jgi:hypothetical protein